MNQDKKNKLINKALRQHHRDSGYGRKVSPDYLLMFTEGGEANAIADIIEKETKKELVNWVEVTLKGN